MNDKLQNIINDLSNEVELVQSKHRNEWREARNLREQLDDVKIERDGWALKADEDSLLLIKASKQIVELQAEVDADNKHILEQRHEINALKGRIAGHAGRTFRSIENQLKLMTLGRDEYYNLARAAEKRERELNCELLELKTRIGEFIS